MMRNLLYTFGFVACSLISSAQTINIGDMTPQIGHVYTQENSDYVSPGTSGANQTWDLSGMTTNQTFTTTISSPVGLPGAEDFPSATFASVIQGQESIGYSAVINNRIEIVGLYTPTASMTYPNPQTQLQFPLSFQSTYSDTYERNVDFGGGIGNQEIGEASTIVDGYGTLITPTGTYTDVLRLKQDVEADLNTTSNGQVISTIPFTSVTYVFIKVGFIVPLASIVTSEFSGQTTEFATYYISSTVGLDKVSPVNNITIFPVPIVNDFTVNLNLEGADNVTFELFSIDGRMVAQLGKEFLPKGENTRSFTLPQSTASGVYLLQIKTPDSALMKKILVQ
ncbi:T9SS type A sorting domain-containing protein [Cryomorpha ignava]|uniref:T9SS type A sorting domain-containing protein n=1 Tax=Cryomorpha ignava TaxID=101383 RepID=A0A7K3WQ89_9FLAO|nr:T9SS type A sorting domain-containing protein [Cryomorpha ignava]NEN23052.1 T9SS type A sorting domain-containing protein [Cryomorpha ignava]